MTGFSGFVIGLVLVVFFSYVWYNMGRIVFAFEITKLGGTYVAKFRLLRGVYLEKVPCKPLSDEEEVELNGMIKEFYKSGYDDDEISRFVCLMIAKSNYHRESKI